MTDEDEVPDTSDRLPASPCPASPRSLRASVVIAALTGAIIVVVPFGLLLGRDGLVPVSLDRQDPIPAPRLLDCDSGQAAGRAIAPGQCVKVVGAGFEPNELIEVSNSRHPSWQAYLHADKSGHYSLRLVTSAAETIGPEVLTLVGSGPSKSDAGPRMTYLRLTIAASTSGN